MKNLLRFGIIAFAFVLMFISVDVANAQSWKKQREARREYRDDVRDARREYREDIRDGKSRWKAEREYREEIRDAQRDYRRDTNRNYDYNRRSNPYYRNNRSLLRVRIW